MKNAEMKSLLFWSKFEMTINHTDAEAQAKADKHNNKILADAEAIYNHYLKSTDEQTAQARKEIYLKNNPLKTFHSFKTSKG